MRAVLLFTLSVGLVGACLPTPDAPPRDASVDAPDDRSDLGGASPKDAREELVVEEPVDVALVGPDVPDREDGGIVGPTYDYVLTAITIDEGLGDRAPVPATHPNALAGFDLDGRFTGPSARSASECGHGDFFSVLDADQNRGGCRDGSPAGGATCVGGVDNQFPEVAQVLRAFGIEIRRDFRARLQGGLIAVLVRLSGVDGPLGPDLDDDQVTVRVYPFAHPLFADCARFGEPGLPYAVDERSLAVPGDLARARYRFDARIVRGRLQTRPTGSTTVEDFSLELPIGADNDMIFHQATIGVLRAQIRGDLSVDGIARGNFGCAAPVDQAVTALAPALPPDVSIHLLRTVVQSFVDIAWPPGAAGCRAPTGLVSLGMGYTAARATIAPMSVSGPQPGRCGARPASP